MESALCGGVCGVGDCFAVGDLEAVHVPEVDDTVEDVGSVVYGPVEFDDVYIWLLHG
jgi:hypothetical protein